MDLKQRTGEGSSGRASEGMLWRRIQIGLPLVIGLGLMATFVVLLLSHFQSEKEPQESSTTAALDVSVSTEQLAPSRSAAPAAEPVAEKRPLAPGLKRWNLKSLPKGWDPELAAELARLIGMIDFDRSDRSAYAAVGPAFEEFLAFLASLGPDALPTLTAILNAETDFVSRRRIAEAIGRMGLDSEAATLILTDFFNKRYHQVQARSEMNHVIKAMGQLHNDSAYDSMVELMDREDMPDHYKDKLIVELGEHPRREESRGLFVDMMHESRDQNVRNHSAQALGKFGTAGDLPDLYSAYDRERRKGHWVIRQTILGSIGKIGDPSSLTFLEEQARYATEDGVRLSAASAIRRVGTRQAYSILDDLGRTEKNVRVRGRIQGWASR